MFILLPPLQHRYLFEPLKGIEICVALQMIKKRNQNTGYVRNVLYQIQCGRSSGWRLSNILLYRITRICSQLEEILNKPSTQQKRRSDFIPLSSFIIKLYRGCIILVRLLRPQSHCKMSVTYTHFLMVRFTTSTVIHVLKSERDLQRRLIFPTPPCQGFSLLQVSLWLVLCYQRAFLQVSSGDLEWVNNRKSIINTTTSVFLLHSHSDFEDPTSKVISLENRFYQNTLGLASKGALYSLLMVVSYVFGGCILYMIKLGSTFSLHRCMTKG